MNESFAEIIKFLIGILIILLILLIFQGCSSQKEASYQHDTMEAEVSHKVKIECDLLKKKKCIVTDDLNITRETGFKTPIFQKSDSLLDHPAVQGAIGK